MEEKYYSRLFKLILIAGDIFLIYSVIIAIHKFGVTVGGPSDGGASFALIFAFGWVAVGMLLQIYSISKFSLMRSVSINLLGTLAIHLLVIITIVQSTKAYTVDIMTLLKLYLITGALMGASRIVFKLLSKYLEFQGFDLRRVVVVGTTASGKALYRFFSNHHPSGYTFMGFFDNHPNTQLVDGRLVRGGMDDLEDFCVREKIDEIYFALPSEDEKLLERLRRFTDDQCIYLRIAPDFSKIIQEGTNVYLYDSTPVFTNRREPLGISMNTAVKRAFDIVFSSLVILLIFPIVVPIIALAIKIDSPGPIIFKQLRPGKRNKLFECYKFRTMRVNNTTEQMATKGDARVTKVGAFLRKTSLDELPQFINVLLGSMSVVGPRPNLLSQLEEYSKTLDKYKVRHFVTPGITGYAQVNGCRGEVKQKESMAKRVEYDVAYMENWSLLLDLKIIFQTIQKVFIGDKQAY
jgi:putative colanic acid biosynthesis UDP-glucose lipid carrier transferase